MYPMQSLGMTTMYAGTDWVANREQEYILEYVKRLEEFFDTRVFDKMRTGGSFGFKMSEDEEVHLLKYDKQSIQLFE